AAATPAQAARAGPRHRLPGEESAAGRSGARWGCCSVRVSGISPGGKAGDEIEFLEKGTDELVGVFPGAEVIELTHRPGQCGLHVGNGPLREVVAMLLQTLLMLEKFFPVELGN